MGFVLAYNKGPSTLGLAEEFANCFMKSEEGEFHHSVCRSLYFKNSNASKPKQKIAIEFVEYIMWSVDYFRQCSALILSIWKSYNSSQDVGISSSQGLLFPSVETALVLL